MSWLCEAFGISRKTGYKWLERYRRLGVVGLADVSRAPLHPGRSMACEQRDAILALRERWPHWGPRKLRAKLLELHPGVAWPAASSIGELLRRLELVRPRRRRRRVALPERPLSPARAANDVWCADFKGWVRSGDGRRCDPLTVSDAHSRFLLGCQLVGRPDHQHVRPVFERLFERYGLPRAIRTDNGPPFASCGAGGLSALAIWWLKLGIRPERIEPGKPQQNGRHERLHLTLKQEAMTPPAASWADQQRRLDDFRRDYNLHRPHEALGQQPPGRAYAASHRHFDGRERAPAYGAEQAVRRVRSNGEIRWAGRLVFIGEALIGEPVALSQTESGDWAVHYFDILLGHLDRQGRKLRRLERGHAPARGKKVSPMSPV